LLRSAKYRQKTYWMTGIASALTLDRQFDGTRFGLKWSFQSGRSSGAADHEQMAGAARLSPTM
jgi:hypothetical protein